MINQDLLPDEDDFDGYVELTETQQQLVDHINRLNDIYYSEEYRYMSEEQRDKVLELLDIAYDNYGLFP